MPLFEFGSPTFGLRDGKVAVNNGNGTFGTLVDVPSIKMFGVKVNMTEAELEGDDQITATAAKPRSADVSFSMGGINLEVLNVLMGQAIQSSGTSPVSRRMNISNKKTAYFGVSGIADAAEATGQTHLFIPKCKVRNGFELRMEYGAFAIPELQCTAVADDQFLDADSLNVLMKIVQYNIPTVIAMPPS